MITAIVQLDLSKLPPAVDIRAVYESSIPKYVGFPGLIRKYYLLDEERRVGGGAYLFKTKEDGQRLFSAEWRAGLQTKMGIDPVVNYYETPIVVDNLADDVTRA
ncbi:MAG: monooxygenase [Pseudomonadota bacterium]